MSEQTIIPPLLIKAIAKDDDRLYKLGLEVGQLYTDHGYPIDMALAVLDYTKNQKIAILHGALHWLVIHRRNSGASDKAIDRQRLANATIMKRFIDTDETGVY